MNISRRHFLRSSAAFAVGLTVASFNGFAAETAGIERKDVSKRVIIVGAGLAGLEAAYELTQAGHDVTVIEAQDRAGGRVYTLRECFPDGLYVEVGGVGYDESPLVQKYLT
jgi:monoamine oxidase